MPIISTAALAQMRAQHDRLLPDSCEVLRVGQTRDGGGVAEGDATIVATYPCRLVPYAGPRSASGEQAMADRLALTSPWKVALPALADVTPDDRMRITVEGQPAKTYEVKYVSGRQSLESGSFALLEFVP